MTASIFSIFIEKNSKAALLNQIQRYKNIVLFCCFSLFFSSISHAYQKRLNVWHVLRQQFVLNHQIKHPEVRKQLLWISAHPEYIEKLARQSEPYIYHILSEIKKKKLPGELALIPMIESGYDPFAYSGAGAAGLWQLMPGTGSGLGLQQDWWFDGRRSIPQSTRAALEYFSYLRNYFRGNWMLAIAAYDSGQGKIHRALKEAGFTRDNAEFWRLKVPRETRKYIPRLLAIAEVLQNPERYHVNLPPIAYEPYFESVNIGTQIDLNQAAKLADISYTDLIRLNPGYNRWVTAPDKPYHLLLPIEKVEQFNQQLNELPEHHRVSWQRHQVKSGQTLSQIALQYHSSVNLIKKINNLKTDKLKLNQYLLIPGHKNLPHAVNQTVKKIKRINRSTASRFQRVVHIVQKEDSYRSLSRMYGVTPGEIRYWNNLPSARTLPVGTQLTLWKRRGSKSGTYVVKPGDSLSKIAYKHQLKTQKILSLNPGIKKDQLKPGQRIRLA